MRADPAHPTIRNVRAADADTVYFWNGGEREVVRLAEAEWRSCEEATDPRAFMARLVRLFLEKNRFGFGVIEFLLRAQVQDEDTDETIYPYVRRVHGKVPEKQKRLWDGGTILSACADGRAVLPLRLVVVVARLFGVPEEVLLARGSKAAESYRSHLGLRAANDDLTSEEQSLYDKVAPVVDALPLRQRLAPREVLELYRQMQAIT